MPVLSVEPMLDTANVLANIAVPGRTGVNEGVRGAPKRTHR